MPTPTPDFDTLVSRIQATSDVLRQDALVVINRNVTTRAWLTGYYIVEYEQHGKDRAEYGAGLLKALAERLEDRDVSHETLKKNRRFYQTYPDLAPTIASYLSVRFGKGDSGITQLPAPIPQIGESVITRSEERGILAQSGKEMVEYVNAFIAPQLFLSKYQLQLPPKEKIAEFLRHENATHVPPPP